MELKLSEKVIYKWGYVIFPLELTLAPTIKIDGQAYIAKKEFHVSLLCAKDYVAKLAKRLGKSEDEALRVLLDRTSLALGKYPLVLGPFLNVFLKAEKENRKSLVVRVKMNGLEKVLEFISKEISLPIEIPPTHITLYTLKNRLSVPLNSHKDIVAYSKQLDKRSQDLVKRSIKS